MSDYVAILLEDINHKFDAIMEGQAAMSHVPRTINEIDERLQNVETDIKAIKAAVTDHPSQLENHEGRIGALEQSVR